MASSNPEIVTLREYIETLMEAHQREHELLAERNTRDRSDMERRLGEMNELRAQISSERGRYVTRELLDAQISAVCARVSAIERPVWVGIAVVGLLSVVVPVLVGVVWR